MIDAKLLEFVVCPGCRGPLKQIDDSELQCAVCGLRYPVRDGIPVLILDQARK